MGIIINVISVADYSNLIWKKKVNEENTCDVKQDADDVRNQ